MTSFGIIILKMFVNCDFCFKPVAYTYLNMTRTNRGKKCTSCGSRVVALDISTDYNFVPIIE